jgi:L-alanine-DL-glutamate epimerase-like enolase superfamily enzyme
LQDDILAEPLELADGLLAVPEGAGLGVEVDREKLEKYRAK